MSGFKQFIAAAKSKGGIWATEDVQFAQMRDIYSAGYKPEYPNDSPHDQTLNYDHRTHMWSHYGAKEEQQMGGDVEP